MHRVSNGPTLLRADRLCYERTDPGLNWPTLAHTRSKWIKLINPKPFSTTFAQTDQARDLNLTVFFTRYSKTSDLRTFLISFFIVSLVLQWVNKRVFSCSSIIAEIHEKIYKNYFVWRFPWNRSYADWQVLAWVTIYPLFLATWVEKMTCWARIQSFQPWKHKHKCWSLPFPGQSPLLNLAGHFFNSSQ